MQQTPPDDDDGKQRPNVADPLSEPLRHRRIWACYLHKGFTRASFARAMGTTWSVVQAWDLGKRNSISLEKLILAGRVLGYSLDELCHGKQTLVGREPTLGHAAIMEALREIGASADARAAFARHLESAEGRYQELTRSYVQGWVSGYGSGGEALALARGVNERALANAVASTAPAAVDLGGSDAALTAALRDVVERFGPKPKTLPKRR